MEEQAHERTYVAGIIEREDNHVLIVLPEGNTGMSREWQFPRGRTRQQESPEAAMRRIARDDLGIEVEIVVGQPPIVAEVDGSDVELRYFFCGMVAGELKVSSYSEARWVSQGHLREYELDPASRPVAAWMLDTKR